MTNICLGCVKTHLFAVPAYLSCKLPPRRSINLFRLIGAGDHQSNVAFWLLAEVSARQIEFRFTLNNRHPSGDDRFPAD